MGEGETLAQAVERGDLRCAYRLAERDPARALRAITVALTSIDAWNRPWFVDIVGRLDVDGAEAVLLRELREGPLRSRASAARALHRRGRTEGEAEALRSWTALHVPDDASDLDATEEDLEALVALLVTIGSPAAIDALRADLARRPAVVRAMVVSGLLLKGNRGWGVSGGRLCGAEASLDDARASAAAEALLLAALDDDESAGVLDVRVGDVGLTEPRICDLAALALTRRWPERHLFDMRAPVAEREVVRLAAVDAWRANEGLPPRPRAASPEERRRVLRVRVVDAERAPDLAARARALEGKPLDAAAIPDLLGRLVDREPWGRVGLDVRVIALQDEVGLEVTVRIVSPERHRAGQRFLGHAYSLGMRFSSRGGYDMDACERAGDVGQLGQLAQAIELALDDPVTRFSLRARVVPGRDD